MSCDESMQVFTDTNLALKNTYNKSTVLYLILIHLMNSIKNAFKSIFHVLNDNNNNNDTKKTTSFSEVTKRAKHTQYLTRMPCVHEE